MVVKVMDDLNKIKQEISLIRAFSDVTPTLGFNEDEACGLAWILDSWMERIDKAVDTLKQG